MPERNRMDCSDLILDTNYDLGPVTFTSITGWRSMKEDIWTDFDAEPLVLFETKRPQDAGQFSQELWAAGDLIEDVLNSTVGWYYYDSHYTLNGSTDMDTRVFLPGCPSGAPGVASFTTVGKAHQSMYSNGYFGQLIGSVTPIMNLYAGGRWTVDDKDFDILPACLTLGGAGAASGDERFRKFTPKVGMDYQITPELFTGAQCSTGFRAGGFNGRAARIVPESVGPYGSETRGSIETGLKSDWLDRHLRVNLTGVSDRYRDLQLPVIVPTGNPISPQETLTQNAGSAKIWGLELETISKPLDELTVWASVGYLHAKYLEFDADLDGDGSIDDNTDLDLMRTPKCFMHVETLYEFPLMDFGMLGVHAGWTYFSHQATSVSNAPTTNVPALSLYAGSSIYRPMDSQWRFTLYGKNLFNRVTQGGGLDVAGLFAVNGPIAPRTYGVQVGWQYDDLGELFTR